MTKIIHLVVHYSATYADQNLTVKDIDKMHRAHGWKMVGYHYVKVQKKGAPETKPVSPDAPAKTGHLGEQKEHVVAKGETWWSISQMYGLGVADLAGFNGSSPLDTLAVGRRLALVAPTKPAPAPAPIQKPAVSFWAWLTNLIFGRN